MDYNDDDDLGLGILCKNYNCLQGIFLKENFQVQSNNETRLNKSPQSGGSSIWNVESWGVTDSIFEA